MIALIDEIISFLLSFFSPSSRLLLSEHYSLEDLIVTKQNIENIPSSYEIENLRFLARSFLERLRKKTSFRITSAYRTAQLNRLVGGTESSKHIEGLAVDISSSNNIELMKLIMRDFRDVVDEAILYNTHVHVSVSRTPRRRFLIASTEGYSQFLG